MVGDDRSTACSTCGTEPDVSCRLFGGHLPSRHRAFDASRDMLAVARSNLDRAGSPRRRGGGGATADIFNLPLDGQSLISSRSIRCCISRGNPRRDCRGRAHGSSRRPARDHDSRRTGLEHLRDDHAHARLGFAPDNERMAAEGGSRSRRRPILPEGGQRKLDVTTGWRAISARSNRCRLAAPASSCRGSLRMNGRTPYPVDCDGLRFPSSTSLRRTTRWRRNSFRPSRLFRLRARSSPLTTVRRVDQGALPETVKRMIGEMEIGIRPRIHLRRRAEGGGGWRHRRVRRLRRAPFCGVEG